MIKGKPLPLSGDIPAPDESELDLINARWDKYCPPYYRGLLDAQSINASNPTSRFVYDRARMRYIHRATGRVLTLSEIRQAYIQYSRKVEL